MAALNIQGLHKRFGTVNVLKGIDLTIDGSEFIVRLATMPISLIYFFGGRYSLRGLTAGAMK